MEAFRKLLETTNPNDTMSPNWRPVQPLYGRTIYNCQEDIDADMVEKEAIPDTYTEEEYSDVDNAAEVWFIVGIVFIILSGITLIVIGYFAYKLFIEEKPGGRHTRVATTDNTDDKRETGNGYH